MRQPHLSFSLRTRIIAAVVVTASLVACSLIVDKDKDQCSSTADCSPAGSAMCIDGVCVVGGGSDAANDGNAVADSQTGDGATDGACVPKVPVSQDDFLNEKCTNAQCIPFDNCARIGLCPGVDGGDGGLPALVDPPDGGV
jgi:hypothetical protein